MMMYISRKRALCTCMQATVLRLPISPATTTGCRNIPTRPDFGLPHHQRHRARHAQDLADAGGGMPCQRHEMELRTPHNLLHLAAAMRFGKTCPSNSSTTSWSPTDWPKCLQLCFLKPLCQYHPESCIFSLFYIPGWLEAESNRQLRQRATSTPGPLGHVRSILGACLLHIANRAEDLRRGVGCWL